MRLSKKNLLTKLILTHAYGKTNMSHFISNGAFGGAMQEIIRDAVKPQLDALAEAPTDVTV